MVYKNQKALQLFLFGQIGGESLSLPALEAGYVTKTMKGIIEKMKKTAAQYNSVYLTANQVGLEQNLFIIKQNSLTLKSWKDNLIKSEHYKLYLNPSILELSLLEKYEWEECLSLPCLKAFVKRSEQIKFKYQQDNGTTAEGNSEDFEARVIQHEIDHLLGKSILNLKNSQGNIQIMEQYQCQETSTLQKVLLFSILQYSNIYHQKKFQKILKDYQYFAEQIKIKYPEYFVKDVQHYQMIQEINNPRTYIKQLQQENKNEKQIIIEQFQKKEEQFIQEIGQEVFNVCLSLNIPQKRKKVKNKA